jgi:hypothetical protein
MLNSQTLYKDTLCNEIESSEIVISVIIILYSKKEENRTRISDKRSVENHPTKPNGSRLKPLGLRQGG